MIIRNAEANIILKPDLPASAMTMLTSTLDFINALPNEEANVANLSNCLDTLKKQNEGL